ncbi:MAG: hypothetical protein QG615_1762 [Nitrospirota bacterium]|nr:hypothetical protein [Nitrospirota bacterium]
MSRRTWKPGWRTSVRWPVVGYKLEEVMNAGDLRVRSKDGCLEFDGRAMRVGEGGVRALRNRLENWCRTGYLSTAAERRKAKK